MNPLDSYDLFDFPSPLDSWISRFFDDQENSITNVKGRYHVTVERFDTNPVPHRAAAATTPDPVSNNDSLFDSGLLFDYYMDFTDFDHYNIDSLGSVQSHAEFPGPNTQKRNAEDDQPQRVDIPQTGSQTVIKSSHTAQKRNAEDDHKATPTFIPHLSDITDISIGRQHILPLSESGHIYSWGANTRSRLSQLSPFGAKQSYSLSSGQPERN